MYVCNRGNQIALGKLLSHLLHALKFEYCSKELILFQLILVVFIYQDLPPGRKLQIKKKLNNGHHPF